MNTATQADTATPVTNLPLPELTPVQSSQIFAIGYSLSNMLLAVQFVRRENGERKPGSVYTYSKVPLEVANAFQTAESHGTYFGKHIKGLYDFRKVS